MARFSRQGVDTLLGPLVQTALLNPSSLSHLVVNTNGLPTTVTTNAAYSGTFSCSNIPTGSVDGDALSASCDITHLPAGLSVAGCSISPSNIAWIQPSDIPANQIVTCLVTGAPIAVGASTATVTSNATNNSNSTTNQVNATITVTDSISPPPPPPPPPVVTPPVIPVTLNGVVIKSPAVVCCGRPAILGALPVPGSGVTTFSVSKSTGNVRCIIGHTGAQTYLKVNGAAGSSCTIIGVKDGVTSAPFTVITT